MASTSTAGQVGTGVNAVAENESTFDVNHGLAGVALGSNALSFYEYLEVPECTEPSPLTSPTDLFQIPVDEDWNSASVSAPMRLLNQGEQEMADLFLLYPKAKVEGSCITAFHYNVIMKLFLCSLKLSQNCMEDVPHPKAMARLLCRLSRELKSAPSFESCNLPDRFSDPADYDGCLGELLKDMEEYIKTPDTPSLPEGYVYVRRGTDTYAQVLLAAATKLKSSSS